VPNQSDKDQAFGLVSGHKAVESIVNNVQVELNVADVETNLNKALAEAGFSSVPAVQLDKDLVATLRGSANDPPEKDRMLALAKGISGIKGVKDEIEVVAPQAIPEPENMDIAEEASPQPSPQPPLSPQASSQRVVDRAALERDLNALLRSSGDGRVRARVNSDMSVVLSGSVRREEERNYAISIAEALSGRKATYHNVQVVAPQVVKLEPSQAPQANMAIDPAKLEGDINRALRGRDINSITAQVNDDMSLTLKGSASATEKERALQLARQVRGIHGIKDKIFVVE
jgi:osmotically-inducible protein OsmY